MEYSCVIQSPIGNLLICENGNAITKIAIVEETIRTETTPLLKETIKQLNEYFSGTRKNFQLPLSPAGTIFQRQVWNALLTIPYGETKTYREIARQIGSPKACRAVGLANHYNPIIIVIPCHRVIGANGTLVGYGGGLPVKEYLLHLENASF